MEYWGGVDLNNDLLYEINELLRKNIYKYERLEMKSRALRALAELTLTEIKTIYVIGDKSSVNMKEIAEALDVSVSTPTTTIDRLIKKGCVKRYTGIEDRRNVFVKLTERGKELYKEIVKIKLETTRILLEALSNSEIAFLNEILVKLDKHMSLQFGR